MGRTRKIPMARRETAKQRSVTLTKRRQGLFNKAAELCRICDARIAIMVSSTGSKEKVYAFGHSSVDAVFNKFLDDFPASEAAGASDEEEIKSACNSLHEDIKALESEVTTLIMQNKKINAGGISWDFLDEFERSGSVQELQDAVKSLESLLGLAKKKMNNPTGNLGISNIIEPRSDGYLALGFKPHYGSSSSLDDKVCQNSANNVEFISANYSDSWATSDGSPGNNGIDFPGEVDIDYIWDCIPSLDFNSDSDRVNSDNSSYGCATSRTAYGSDSRSQENGDNVFPASLDSGYLEAMEFLDYGIKTIPGSVFGDIKQH
ncbi:agamous MADS-box protein [Salix suchowensis]|nr:agamous MADS-box protein [Salix suchowensis]